MKAKKIIIILCVFAYAQSVLATRVTFVNESPYPVEAKVRYGGLFGTKDKKKNKKLKPKKGKWRTSSGLCIKNIKIVISAKNKKIEVKYLDLHMGDDVCGRIEYTIKKTKDYMENITIIADHAGSTGTGRTYVNLETGSKSSRFATQPMDY